MCRVIQVLHRGCGDLRKRLEGAGVGVEPILLLEHGAVSAPVAEAMARRYTSRAETDFRIVDYWNCRTRRWYRRETSRNCLHREFASEAGTEHRKLKLPAIDN
jgi:hypothetical protein